MKVTANSPPPDTHTSPYTPARQFSATICTTTAVNTRHPMTLSTQRRRRSVTTSSSTGSTGHRPPPAPPTSLFRPSRTTRTRRTLPSPTGHLPWLISPTMATAVAMAKATETYGFGRGGVVGFVCWFVFLSRAYTRSDRCRSRV